MRREDPHLHLRDAMTNFLTSKIVEEDLLRKLLDDLPQRWEKFSNVVLLQNSAFNKPHWKEFISIEFWLVISSALGVNTLARIGEIIGEKRESTVEVLVGDDDWVIRRENGIDYGYNLTKCMFSTGNINERRRMGEVGQRGEIVVDLFSGIGYYSLPMLVAGKVAEIHCCEWNENAIKALNWNLKRNKVEKSCKIHEGDNRITVAGLKGVANRVILGLLPNVEQAFDLGLACLVDSGGIMHIHGIAPAKNYDEWITEKLDELREIDPAKTIVEHSRIRVKSYAPHWDHIVLDVLVSTRKQRVMAFEDSVDISALLVSGGVDLTKFEFHQCWNTMNAIDKIREFSPDILLLDHFIPPIKGLEVLNLVNQNVGEEELNRPRKILGISSSDSANQNMLNAGADSASIKFKLAEHEVWRELLGEAEDAVGE